MKYGGFDMFWIGPTWRYFMGLRMGSGISSEFAKLQHHNLFLSCHFLRF